MQDESSEAGSLALRAEHRIFGALQEQGESFHKNVLASFGLLDVERRLHLVLEAADLDLAQVMDDAPYYGAGMALADAKRYAPSFALLARISWQPSGAFVQAG